MEKVMLVGRTTSDYVKQVWQGGRAISLIFSS